MFHLAILLRVPPGCPLVEIDPVRLRFEVNFSQKRILRLGHFNASSGLITIPNHFPDRGV